MKTYMATDDELSCLEAVRDKLYRQERLSADEMRDLAHKLDGAIRNIRQLSLD